MRWLAACLLTGIISSVVTVWMLQTRLIDAAIAQDRRVRSVSPIEKVHPGVSRFFDSDDLTAEEIVNTSVYDAANRSVVNITSKSVRSGLLLEVQAEGSGSGAVLDTDGHVLTNYHVVKDAKEVQVALFNGNTYDATRVGADPLNDIAIVKIDAPADELFPVAVGDSRQLKVGMRVYALGNPFGLERTLTTGIISSLNRSLQIHGSWTIKSIIQIDAAINPGSSGGPLLDSHGRLIGINTAIATTSGQSAGVGFAIPVSIVSRVVPQLLAHGRVIRAETGILRVLQTEKGLLIAELRSNGPAEKAGLRGPALERTRRGPFVIERLDRSAADVIVAVDEEKVASADDFLSYIEQKRPGEEVRVTVLRGGRKQEVRLTLSSSDPAPRD